MTYATPCIKWAQNRELAFRRRGNMRRHNDTRKFGASSWQHISTLTQSICSSGATVTQAKS